MVAAIAFVASMLGILTRVEGSFAAFWPANPIILGILIRDPKLGSLWTWIAAFAGYLAAYLVTGGGYAIALWLSSANLAGMVIGFLLFRQLSDGDMSLKSPLSVVWLFLICLVSAIVSALIGALAVHVMFGSDFIAGFALWFTTELVNTIILLPLILTASTVQRVLPFIRAFTKRRLEIRSFLPAIALLIMIAASMIVGRPGSFAYPIPALLWCAMSYSLFTTTILTLCFSVWALIAIPLGILPFLMGDDPLMATVSQRLAIVFIALGPLAVACLNTMKDDLLRRFEHAANYDFLTNTLARGALLEAANNLMKREDRAIELFCVLMLDIDNFKAINDNFGHATGDQVLVTFSDLVFRELRSDYLFGRLGGEEFAVIFKTRSSSEAKMVAERIRRKTEELAIHTSDGVKFKISVSGGLVSRAPEHNVSLDDLLANADKCLYRAKSAGKNKIILADNI